MPRSRRLRPVLACAALLSARCTPDAPPFDATSSASQPTGAPTTQSSFPGETTAGASTAETPTTAAPPTTGDLPPDTTDATTTAATTGTSEVADTSSGGTTTTTDTTTGANVCGDGEVAGDEVCDDGDDDDGDACLSDCTAGQTVLVLAGQGDAPGLWARWVPGPGWTIAQAGVGVIEAALTPADGGALAAVRRASPQAQDVNELVFATWSSGQPDELGNFAEVGEFGFGIDGPALATHGEATLLAFLGTDYKHYWTQREGGAWSPFAPLPATMNAQAFGPSAAALASDGLAAYGVYAGDNSQVYYNAKSGPGGAWTPSMPAPPPPVAAALTPTALVDAAGDLVIAYARKSDGRLGVVKLLTPQNAWTTETLVHAEAATAAEVALVETDAGALWLAWRTTDGEAIRAARGTDHATWAAPITVEAGASVQPPALARGAVGAEAELVYAAGGALRHARLSGETADVADVPGAGGVTTRAAALRVQLAP